METSNEQVKYSFSQTETVELAENVPLTAKEAKELSDIDGLRIRTLRKKLEAAS